MQLSYISVRKPGLVGQKSDSSPSHVVSAFSNNAIQPGALVVFDGEGKCKLPATKEDLAQALGVVLSEGLAPKPNSMLSVLRSGRVWVEASGNIVAGALASLNLKTQALGIGDGPDWVKLKNACFVSNTGEIAELELNFVGGVS